MSAASYYSFHSHTTIQIKIHKTMKTKTLMRSTAESTKKKQVENKRIKNFQRFPITFYYKYMYCITFIINLAVDC